MHYRKTFYWVLLSSNVHYMVAGRNMSYARHLQGVVPPALGLENIIDLPDDGDNMIQ